MNTCPNTCPKLMKPGFSCLSCTAKDCTNPNGKVSLEERRMMRDSKEPAVKPIPRQEPIKNKKPIHDTYDTGLTAYVVRNKEALELSLQSMFGKKLHPIKTTLAHRQSCHRDETMEYSINNLNRADWYGYRHR